jgi:hypothetical protein
MSEGDLPVASGRGCVMCNIQPAKKTRQQSTGETQYVMDDVTVFQ